MSSGLCPNGNGTIGILGSGSPKHPPPVLSSLGQHCVVSVGSKHDLHVHVYYGPHPAAINTIDNIEIIFFIMISFLNLIHGNRLNPISF